MQWLLYRHFLILHTIIPVNEKVHDESRSHLHLTFIGKTGLIDRNKILIQKCQFTSPKEKLKAFSFKSVIHYYWQICTRCKNKQEIQSKTGKDMFVPEKCVHVTFRVGQTEARMWMDVFIYTFICTQTSLFCNEAIEMGNVCIKLPELSFNSLWPYEQRRPWWTTCIKTSKPLLQKFNRNFESDPKLRKWTTHFCRMISVFMTETVCSESR